MDQRAEFFGQWCVAPVVECSRLAALPTREILRNALSAKLFLIAL